MRYNIYAFIWDTFEILYSLTGLRCQAPIEWFFPNMGPWLFGKMIGSKGVKIEPNIKP